MKKAKKTKKVKQKKFEIRLNGFQAHLISEALDNYMRLLIGQFDCAIDNIRLRFYSNSLVEQGDEARKIISRLKQIVFPGLNDNASYGVGWKGIPEINDMYEMYKMINKALWESQNEKGKKLTEWSVDRDGVIVKYSKEPLIEVKEIKTNETKEKKYAIT